jgi:hypothetical protein
MNLTMNVFVRVVCMFVYGRVVPIYPYTTMCLRTYITFTNGVKNIVIWKHYNCIGAGIA